MCAQKKNTKPRSKVTCRTRLTPRALPKRRSCTYEHKLGNYAKLRLSKSGQLPSEAAPSKQQGANLQLDLTSNTSAQRTRAAQSRRRFDRSFGQRGQPARRHLRSTATCKKKMHRTRLQVFSNRSSKYMVPISILPESLQ